MLYKYILSIIDKWHIFKDALINFIVIKSSHVQYNIKPKINGRIIIKNKGKIFLGDNVLINNNNKNNPVGLPHPTILCTLNISAEILIGSKVGISGASIVSSTSVTIGDRVLVGGGVCIWDTDFHPLDFEMRKENQTKGAQTEPILIEEDVFIGARSIILKGVVIGKGSVIGAGSVVAQNVPSYSVAFGNPLIIRNRFNKDAII